MQTIRIRLGRHQLEQRQQQQQKPPQLPQKQPAAEANHAKLSWREALAQALQRQMNKNNSKDVKYATLVDQELDQIKRETHTEGKTPEKTLARMLKVFRDSGAIEFVNNQGLYRIIDLNQVALTSKQKTKQTKQAGSASDDEENDATQKPAIRMTWDYAALNALRRQSNIYQSNEVSRQLLEQEELARIRRDTATRATSVHEQFSRSLKRLANGNIIEHFKGSDGKRWYRFQGEHAIY